MGIDLRAVGEIMITERVIVSCRFNKHPGHMSPSGQLGFVERIGDRRIADLAAASPRLPRRRDRSARCLASNSFMVEISSGRGLRCNTRCQAQAMPLIGRAAALGQRSTLPTREPPRHRSDRSAAPAPAGECSSDCARRSTLLASVRRRPACWDARTTAATRYTDPRRYCASPVIGLIIAPWKVEVLPVTFGLVWLDAGPADLRRQQARHGQRIVAHQLGIDAEGALPGEFAIVGIGRQRFRRGGGGLPVGRAGDDRAHHVFHVPSAVHETRRPANRAGPDLPAARPGRQSRPAICLSPRQRAASTSDSSPRGRSADCRSPPAIGPGRAG